MNRGVRGALLTSDRFAAPGQLKLRFSAAPGPDPWHGLPGVISAPRGPRAAIDLASSFACSIIALRRRLGVRIGAGCHLEQRERRASCIARGCEPKSRGVCSQTGCNHEAHRLCCRRGHGERIRRAGPVPGGAASGEDLGVPRGFDLQTSRRRRSSARALSAEFGSIAFGTASTPSRRDASRPEPRASPDRLRP